ncbi:MAG: tetratricopeptide repeat protein, partial [Rhodospirillales bacterium]|nr:tetratricopeptide repeat protein [Rhodospirillales bacterium]
MAVHPRVLRRFIVIAFAATAVAFAGWGVVRHVTQAPPGEYGVRQGNILLSDGKYEKAIERFEAALEEAPRHPGAMMGRAIALLQGGRLQDARAAFDRLIGFLIEQ